MEVAKILNLKCAVITDNDGDYQHNISEKYYTYDNNENIKVSSDFDEKNTTFEICLFNDNSDWIVEKKITSKSSIQKWMLRNKTESAFRILTELEEDDSGFEIPEYIKDAIKWIKD